MRGAFQTTREIFEHPIWNDVPKFRIFFYIYGNAVFAKEGAKVAGMHLRRGQFLRSYRNLQEDLMYIENRSVKKYSLSLIKRKIDSLVKEERLKIEDTELGTLFTVVNYELYQGFYSYEKHNLERRENVERTQRERNENNNKNVKNDKNDLYAADIYARDDLKNDYDRIKSLYMQLSGKGGFDLSPKDEMAIQELFKEKVDIEKALVWLRQCFDEYQPKHSRDKINSFSYCLPFILDKHYAEKEGASGGKIHKLGRRHGGFAKQSKTTEQVYRELERARQAWGGT